MPPEPPGLGRAFEHRTELRPADGGHHPRRAHGAWPDANLNDVGARLDQVSHTGRRDHVPGHNRHGRTELPDRAQCLQHLVLMTVRGVDHEQVGTRVEQQLGLAGHITVDAERGGDP